MILQQKLFTLLHSTEVVALLWVLSILYIAICLPTRWLAGNAKDLGQYGFCYYDMGSVLDLMEDRFEEISSDGSLMINEDYMMDMFSLTVINVDPFVVYLEFMFTEKQSKPVTGCKSND